MNAFARTLCWSWLCGALSCACGSGSKAPDRRPPVVAGVEVALVEPCPSTAPGTGAAPELPTVDLRRQLVKSDEGYTVWGLGYSLRSRQHKRGVTRDPVVVAGYVVATNLASAPRCAVHPTGVADPEDCTAPVPAFWIGDRPDAAISDSLKVMGFASNYAQLYDAIHAFDRGEQAFDAFWGQEIPNPLPAVGAKVSVTGKFGPTFAMSWSGTETDETMGILTFQSMQTLEPAAELATLPGVIRKSNP